MPIISGGGGGGGTFNGGTITTPVIVTDGVGGEGDYGEADVYLFPLDSTSSAELIAVSNFAFLEIKQDTAGLTGERPLRYTDITTGRQAFFVTATGAIATGCNVEVPDGTLAAGQVALWFDSTNGVGNTKLMVKGKSADGTAKTATILLA